MRYALVEGGVCVNIIVLLPYSAARDFPNAYPIENIPVQIGDYLDRGVWMRNGQKVLTYAEQARQEVESVRTMLDEILIEQLTEEGVLIS